MAGEKNKGDKIRWEDSQTRKEMKGEGVQGLGREWELGDWRKGVGVKRGEGG